MINILTELATILLAITTPFAALYCAVEAIKRYPGTRWATSVIMALFVSWVATGIWFGSKLETVEREKATIHLEIMKALIQHEIDRHEAAKKD